MWGGRGGGGGSEVGETDSGSMRKEGRELGLGLGSVVVRVERRTVRVDATISEWGSRWREVKLLECGAQWFTAFPGSVGNGGNSGCCSGRTSSSRTAKDVDASFLGLKVH